MNCSTSPAFVNISPPWAVRPCPFRTGVLPQDPPGTLGARGFRAVSQVFHACYGMAVSRPLPLAGPRARDRVARGLMAEAAPGRQAEPPGGQPDQPAGP